MRIKERVLGTALASLMIERGVDEFLIDTSDGVYRVTIEDGELGIRLATAHDLQAIDLFGSEKPSIH